MRLGSLFDGIGGFPLAAVRNGILPVWASEIERFPLNVKGLWVFRITGRTYREPVTAEGTVRGLYPVRHCLFFITWEGGGRCISTLTI